MGRRTNTVVPLPPILRQARSTGIMPRSVGCLPVPRAPIAPRDLSIKPLMTSAKQRRMGFVSAILAINQTKANRMTTLATPAAAPTGGIKPGSVRSPAGVDRLAPPVLDRGSRCRSLPPASEAKKPDGRARKANMISPTASANRMVTGRRSLCRQELQLIFVSPITSRRTVSKEHSAR